jgi:hypothetical protein
MLIFFTINKTKKNPKPNRKPGFLKTKNRNPTQTDTPKT